MKHTAFFEEARAARKWFLMDKNYILKEAQLVLQDELTEWLVAYARAYYQQQYNPLGLVDSTVARIRQAEFSAYHVLQPFYEKLASVYRYKHGEVQLEFLFDGASHYDKYKNDWGETFKQWVHELFNRWLALRAILEITVFGLHSDHQLQLINQRLQYYIEHHFGVRLYVYKGITDTRAA